MSLTLKSLLVSCAALLPALTASVQAATTLDRIVAVVNDDVITEAQLNARLPLIKRQLAEQRVRMPSDAVLRKGVLDRMVLERLQLQLATQAGLEVKQEIVERELQRLAAQNRLSPEQLMAEFEKEGLGVREVREQVRNQLLVQRLLEREIGDRVKISDTEVQNFLARKQGKTEVEYRLAHIVLAVPEAATPAAIEAVKKRAEALRADLLNGADFEQTAAANSQDDKALEGGNLGWKKAGQLPSLFAEAAADMAIGAISPVLRSANGFHILKLNDKRGSDEASPVQQMRVRHILIRPNELLSAAEARDKLEKLRRRIENGEDFAALARANSDDTASSRDGGDLGWLNPGQTAREFESAAQSLALNVVSEPVRTPYGWHLIEVLDRRQQDLRDERNIAAARAQIHARKADERYEQWLRQLRDEAYVEYKLN